MLVLILVLTTGVGVQHGRIGERPTLSSPSIDEPVDPLYCPIFYKRVEFSPPKRPVPIDTLGPSY